METVRPRLARAKARPRGASYVEILVIVSVVLVLGLLAIRLVGASADEKAEKQAACLQSFSCNGGSSGGPVPIPGAGGPAATGAEGSGGGGFWSGVGDALSSAWNWTQTTQNPVVAFVRGAGSEVTGQVQSIYFIGRHPVMAAQGIWYAVTHPVSTVQQMGREWTDRSTAENLGHAGVMVLEAFTGALAAKGGTVAGGVAQTAAEIAEAGSVGGRARIIGELAKDVVKDVAAEQVKGKPLELPQTGSDAKDHDSKQP